MILARAPHNFECQGKTAVYCTVAVLLMEEAERRTRYGSLLLVGTVAALLYLNSLRGEFVFDDHEAIENNPDVRYSR